MPDWRGGKATFLAVSWNSLILGTRRMWGVCTRRCDSMRSSQRNPKRQNLSCLTCRDHRRTEWVTKTVSFILASRAFCINLLNFLLDKKSWAKKEQSNIKLISVIVRILHFDCLSDMEFLEVLTEGLNRVLLVRGGGREVITIYSWGLWSASILLFLELLGSSLCQWFQETPPPNHHLPSLTSNRPQRFQEALALHHFCYLNEWRNEWRN